MIKTWMTWINYIAGGIMALLLLAAIAYVLMRPSEYSISETSVRKADMPKRAFSRPLNDYEAIGTPALTLMFSPLSVQLPDLRRQLVYYGKNTRPDAKEENPLLYLAFSGNKTPSPVSPGEKLYVIYDKQQSPNQYIFSPNNKESYLWIEATSQGNQATIQVGMKTENDLIINEPASYAKFNLTEKEFTRFGGNVWEIGKWRVDGTLLARQKARWYGTDKFFEKHGGEEYEKWGNKQRIDFGEVDEVYSVYVTLGECLIWQNERWHHVVPGESSLNYPIMCVKKIDERIMNLELWDINGKGKVSLNLIKTNETWLPQNLEQSFKFIGARTRSQFIFEINDERMFLSPHDWLLLTDDGWKKLVTHEDIDNYVERKTTGPLFVFDSIERKDDKQVILGTLFNISRTEMVPVELSLQQGSASSSTVKGKHLQKKQKIKESNVSPMIKNRGRYDHHHIQDEDVDDEDEDDDDDYEDFDDYDDEDDDED